MKRLSPRLTVCACAVSASTAEAAGSELPYLSVTLGGLIALLFALAIALVLQSRRLFIAKAELQDRRSELAHAGRLAAVGELSASIAHEINQPLGAILSNADAAELLLANPQADLGEVRQILADIRAADLRASEVIRRLRSLLEKHEIELREVDLHAALLDVTKVLAGEAKRRGVSMEVALGAPVPTVRGDKVQLQQVLLNLALNAMDAMLATPASRRVVTITTAEADGCIVMQVQDNGTGIPKHDLARIFDSFYTTKPNGLGLGLPIALSIVHAHRGTLKAESRAGAGAAFTLRLPKFVPKTAPVLRGQPSLLTPEEGIAA